ncbi:hypothetical protein QTP88_003707 [Uroleucon formosanum]
MAQPAEKKRTIHAKPNSSDLPDGDQKRDNKCRDLSSRSSKRVSRGLEVSRRAFGQTKKINVVENNYESFSRGGQIPTIYTAAVIKTTVDKCEVERYRVTCQSNCHKYRKIYYNIVYDYNISIVSTTRPERAARDDFLSRSTNRQSSEDLEGLGEVISDKQKLKICGRKVCTLLSRTTRAMESIKMEAKMM